MRARHRRTLERLRPADGSFWLPVLDERAFKKGDVIWVDSGISVGRHEVRACGRGELLVRRISTTEFTVRLWRGRLRRWWRRLWRGRR